MVQFSSHSNARLKTAFILEQLLTHYVLLRFGYVKGLHYRVQRDLSVLKSVSGLSERQSVTQQVLVNERAAEIEEQDETQRDLSVLTYQFKRLQFKTHFEPSSDRKLLQTVTHSLFATLRIELSQFSTHQ
ncbi:Hypothetical_protein [Hexamita inflata]|uniref:Hypothetical_protein n=1 Tax=Hexamita inflata TaxID=28002 RepID=A0AA86TUB5_9EUKA|nr:Hypothetical protein HINF_LOCUS16485 [Hexamita inflata]